jgi:hypothetical protein
MAMLHRMLALAVAVVPTLALAQPMPPCSAEPIPAYGNAGNAPQVGLWTADELHAAHWTPAACLNWTGDSKLVAAVASRFQASDNVFDRLGAVSGWSSVKYWSVSKQGWRPLVLAAWAVDAAGHREANVASANLRRGRDSFFVEHDENSGEITYRLSVLDRSDRRMVVATENVSPIKIAFLTAFEPGALQTVTFVQKDEGGGWSTYQITRVGGGGSSIAAKYKGSFLNRLEAVRRYLAGQPTDQAPPLASR